MVGFVADAAWNKVFLIGGGAYLTGRYPVFVLLLAVGVRPRGVFPSGVVVSCSGVVLEEPWVYEGWGPGDQVLYL